MGGTEGGREGDVINCGGAQEGGGETATAKAKEGGKRTEERRG